MKHTAIGHTYFGLFRIIACKTTKLNQTLSYHKASNNWQSREQALCLTQAISVPTIIWVPWGKFPSC